MYAERGGKFMFVEHLLAILDIGKQPDSECPAGMPLEVEYFFHSRTPALLSDTVLIRLVWIAKYAPISDKLAKYFAAAASSVNEIK